MKKRIHIPAKENKKTSSFSRTKSSSSQKHPYHDHKNQKHNPGKSSTHDSWQEKMPEQIAGQKQENIL